MSSLWIETTKEDIKLSTLEREEEAEICVIGAGLFGLTSAYYLTKQGKNVIILEKGEIGQKVSGNTTGKITSLHGLFYNHLIEDYGEEYAKKYLEANEQAIKNIKQIVEEEKINCDLEERDAYTYTTSQDEVIEIQKEVDAVQKLGKEAEFVTKTELPFQIKGAIKFKNQLQFHARKYMIGLAKKIAEKNKICNYTTVTDVVREDERYKIYTDKGCIYAKYVILATHYPIVNTPGFHFLKMYQSTSYIIAIETEKKLPQGMYINIREPIYSCRTANYNGKQILLIGGSDHKTGKPIQDDSNYRNLENKAKELYPDCKVLFKWNTRDCIGIDKIPYIGEFSKFMPEMYVGTGFKKWGMTSSNIAANIVVDKILGKENKYEEIFTATRIKPIKNRWEMSNMLKETVNSIALNKFKIEPAEISKIENDNGAIIEINGENVGIYKDPEGKIYAIKPNCSHLGCLLSWNNLDKTWDCPCHGSRFDYKGKNIYEPAINELEKIDIDKINDK
ncbi:MAG: FAD-dependent oxidoreductase [Clostridia bacterium]|nr:FAD-dependent oxidoreductase [Clostridia bacterium]